METIQKRRLNLNPSTSALAGVGASAAGLSLISVPAYAVGTVPADVQTAVDNTTATIGALGPIALAAISVALVPFGAGMALKFVRGVMSH